jgi:uncharacterized protein (DUF1697 family)
VRYVALLRGVNVGGHGKLSMAELRAVFENAGMTEVKTYINSGNVVFSTQIEDRQRLAVLLEETIRKRLAFGVDVLLRDVHDLMTIMDALPDHWRNDDSMKCDVMFLWEDVDQPSVVERMPFRPELEDVVYVPGAVIWRLDRENVGKSRMTSLAGTALYKRMTVRNCNTARKLLGLMTAAEN